MKRRAALTTLAMMLSVPALSWAQTGVSDDRVSLPAGPGSLEGVGENVEIDPNMGSMRYSVPIKTPTGINGMQPDLGLSYSSSSPSGVVGIGWSMRTPTIERMTSRGNPLYQTSDLMAADGGMELVLVEDSGEDFVFRERFEKGFKRYTWIRAGDDARDYWKVEYPDGKVGFFGANAQGQRVESARTANEEGAAFKYHLVEMIDPFGNRTLYEYTRPEGSTRALMAKVSWLFVGETPTYTASMRYEARGESVIDAGGGFEEILAHRLAGIELFAKQELLREYVLSYEALSETGGFTRLAGVEEYGLGGVRGGIKNPVAFSFDYQKALGVDCSGVECSDKPYLVDMGALPGGLDLNSGFATLIDINGDALPDILDTSSVGNHKFYLNQLTFDPTTDSFSHRFASEVAESQVGTSGFLRLGGEGRVQTLDINGDGYSDLTNTATGAFLLKDPDRDDWIAPGTNIDVRPLQGIDFGSARFFDYNGDKKIDVLISSGPSTQVIENLGNSFSTDGVPSVTNLGVGFADANLQMSDINGDGMSDAVEILTGNRLRYRVHLGWGRFTSFRDLRIDGDAEISQADLAFTELEDLNGDGRDDIVIVSPTSVRYALNRGDRFDAFVQLDPSNLGFDIPRRGVNTRVLFADMNANGSRDIAWLEGSKVTYLELFPERPNLLSRVENGIGSVQVITYGTAAEHQARARADGRPWTKSLQIPMAVVDQTDVFVTVTGDDPNLHDLVEYDYRDGFYDGKEKQYRGFRTVTQHQVGDADQEEGATVMEYDVGDQDTYFNGLLLSSSLSTGDLPLRTSTTSYDDCPLEGVPSTNSLEAMGRKAVRYVCRTQETNLLQEGAAQAEWKTLQTNYEYDGYGNVIRSESLGDLQVQGDEMVTETTFAAPDNLWHLSLPVHAKVYVDPASDQKETWFYYDGDAFVGEEAGVVTRGFLSRQVQKIDASGKALTSSRQRSDAFGNVIETIDPNGALENEDEHRRVYTYDETGRFLSATELKTTDPEGNPYALRRENRFDLRWQKVSYQVDWITLQDGLELTPRNETTMVYDGLGRMQARVNPGDQPATPSMEVTYELADPVSRVLVHSRTERGGPLDRESSRCVDGLGRDIQTRVLLSPGRYLVTGFKVYNRRGAVVKLYEPYESASEQCDTKPPESVRVTSTRYDAQFRELEKTLPDAELYGSASVRRYAYGPLTQSFFDEEDTDPASPHFNTPTLRRFDGQRRVVELIRSLGEELASYKAFYDNTGSFAGYEDPNGNRHTLTVDLAGRVTQIQNPNTGITARVFDDAGNLLTSTDARGVTLRNAYDGLNRIRQRWDDGDKENTLVTWNYDLDPDCPKIQCTNPAAKLTRVEYPLVVADASVRGNKRMGYDNRGNLILEARGWDAVDLAISTTFNNHNEPIGRTYPDGTVETLTLDRAGRVTAIGSILDEMEYTPRGLLGGIAYHNGASMEMTFDEMMRPATLTHADATGQALESLAYTRDRQGNITGVADMSGRTDVPDATHTLSYDAWYRMTDAALTDADGQAEIITHAYNLLDNVTSLTSSLGNKSPVHVGDIGYDAAKPNAVASAGDLSYEHDAAGSMTRRGGASMGWDHQMRMKSVAQGDRQATYLYSEAQMQVATVADDHVDLYGPASFEIRDGVSHTYFRVNRMRVAVKRSTALMTSIYPDLIEDEVINAADAFAALTGEDAAPRAGLTQAAHPARILGAAAARVLAQEEDVVTYLHNDHLGSLTLSTDEGGVARGQRSFYPNGVARWSRGHVDRYGFTGQEHMDSGLVRFQFRHLDPKVGRWASFDPLFKALTAQQLDKLGDATTGYAYVANNFINLVDPLGLSPKPSVKPKRKNSKETVAKPAAKQADQSNKSLKGNASNGRLDSKEVSGGVDITKSTSSVRGRISTLDAVKDSSNLHLRLKVREINAMKAQTAALVKQNELKAGSNQTGRWSLYLAATAVGLGAIINAVAIGVATN